MAPVELDARPGERYFIRFDGWQGIFTKSDSLHVIPSQEAIDEIDDYWHRDV